MWIVTPLMPHQHYLLNECVRKMPYMALFAPLGTGKSLVALALADLFGGRKVLITADKTNSALTWPLEIETHTRFSFSINDPHSDTIIDIYGYDWLKYHWVEIGNERKYDLWIGDESEAYKNPRTWRVKALRHIINSIPIRIILSGLPVSERLTDIFGQMLCLDDGEALGTSITRFRQRWMLPDINGYGWVPKVNALTEISERLAHIVVTLPASMPVVMPEKRFTTIHVRLDPLRDKVLVATMKALKRDFKLILADGEEEFRNAAVIFGKQYQLCGGTVKLEGRRPLRFASHPKVTVLLDTVKRCGRKIVIWIKHIEEAILLKQALDETDFTVFTLVGGASTAERNTILSIFENAPGRCILVISLGFARGINALSRVESVIFYSRPYSYARRAQAVARTCRLDGSPTEYFDLVLRHSVDENVYQMLSQKHNFTLSIDNFRRIVK